MKKSDKLEPQEQVVYDLIYASGLDGVSPRQILEALDKVPIFNNRPRKDNVVFEKQHSQKVRSIRIKLGMNSIKTIIVDNSTRYYRGDIYLIIGLGKDMRHA